jgi:hypothetical protein
VEPSVPNWESRDFNGRLGRRNFWRWQRATAHTFENWRNSLLQNSVGFTLF